jgi:hypothetical protein
MLVGCIKGGSVGWRAGCGGAVDAVDAALGDRRTIAPDDALVMQQTGI